ncbi:MAG: amidase [Catenulispora sp.]|nr:amidase [Catenulispora sp.]
MEIVDAVLDRLEQVNPAINAFVTVTAEQAREQAAQAAQQVMNTPAEDLKPLHGLPITVKDLTETAGVRTTYGHPAMTDYIAEEDGIAWSRLKAAGAILIGKTTTPEFGLTGICESKLTGITNNPWDTGRTSGGSSGGAAASLAAGIGPLAWGSDGGGSIRVPAACCGVVGHKASSGRIPFSQAGEYSLGVDVEGPLARTVGDTALLLSITAGPHLADPTSLPADRDLIATLQALAAGAQVSLGGKRIAFATGFGARTAEDDVLSVVRAAATVFVDGLGAAVDGVEIELPDTEDYFADFFGPQYALIVDEMAEWGVEASTLWPFVLECAERGRAATAVDLTRTMTATRGKIAAAFSAVFADHDLLITPTLLTPAIQHPSASDDPIAQAGGVLHMLTEPPSHAGLPAVTVNCGFTNAGLPVGLQIIGPYHADGAVLEAAAAFQSATDWHTRHPTF